MYNDNATTEPNSSDIFRKLSLFTCTIYYHNRKPKGTPEHSYRQETKLINFKKGNAPGNLQVNHRYAWERLKDLITQKTGLFSSAVIYENFSSEGLLLYKVVGAAAAEQTAILNFKSLADGAVVLDNIIGQSRNGEMIKLELYPRPEFIKHMEENWKWKQQYLKQQDIATKYKLKTV